MKFKRRLILYSSKVSLNVIHLFKFKIDNSQNEQLTILFKTIKTNRKLNDFLTLSFASIVGTPVRSVLLDSRHCYEGSVSECSDNDQIVKIM